MGIEVPTNRRRFAEISSCRSFGSFHNRPLFRRISKTSDEGRWLAHFAYLYTRGGKDCGHQSGDDSSPLWRDSATGESSPVQ
jgi:hypothetical protein